MHLAKGRISPTHDPEKNNDNAIRKINNTREGSTCTFSILFQVIPKPRIFTLSHIFQRQGMRDKRRIIRIMPYLSAHHPSCSISTGMHSRSMAKLLL